MSDTIKTYVSDKGVTAYKQKLTGSDTGVFFLPGHKNVFDSHKCQLIAELCDKHNVSYTHFTYFGWDGSQSPNVPEGGEGYIQHWLAQAIDLFDAQTQGLQILVGYSMGGYLALALALARPERVKGIIGLAAGFGSGLVEEIKENYNELRVGTDKENGFTFTPQGENHLQINEKLAIACPVRLANAMNDEWVSYKNVTDISSAVESTDVISYIVKTSAHRLQQQDDVAWLEQQLISLAL